MEKTESSHSRRKCDIDLLSSLSQSKVTRTYFNPSEEDNIGYNATDTAQDSKDFVCNDEDRGLFKQPTASTKSRLYTSSSHPKTIVTDLKEASEATPKTQRPKSKILLSTKRGLWTFVNDSGKLSNIISSPVYRISVIVIRSFPFPTHKLMRECDISPRMKFWKTVPRDYFSESYDEIIPYAKKLMSQERYPLYFRLFFETYLEHDELKDDEAVNVILTQCPLLHAVFNYENMGKHQLYYPRSEQSSLQDIWTAMRLNFIYFFKVAQMDLAYSKYCQNELLKSYLPPFQNEQSKQLNRLKYSGGDHRSPDTEENASNKNRDNSQDHSKRSVKQKKNKRSHKGHRKNHKAKRCDTAKPKDEDDDEKLHTNECRGISQVDADTLLAALKDVCLEEESDDDEEVFTNMTDDTVRDKNPTDISILKNKCEEDDKVRDLELQEASLSGCLGCGNDDCVVFCCEGQMAVCSRCISNLCFSTDSFRCWICGKVLITHSAATYDMKTTTNLSLEIDVT